MKIEKERQEMEAQGGLLSLAESGELGKEPVGEEKKSNLDEGQGMDEVLSNPELAGESVREDEKEQAKGSTPKKEMDEYERRRTDFESRRGFPTIEHLNWDEDIWALDLPKKETIAFLNFRAQKLGCLWRRRSKRRSLRCWRRWRCRSVVGRLKIRRSL